jgi:hypothetical protein
MKGSEAPAAAKGTAAALLRKVRREVSRTGQARTAEGRLPLASAAVSAIIRMNSGM